MTGNGLFDPDLIEALTAAASLLLAVFTTLAAGIWAVLRLLEERRVARAEAADLERRRIEQQRIDEEGRRAAHVSALMSRFGETDDPDVRVWTTLALSLYPKETTRLLAMSLGQFSEKMEAGLRLALLSVGTAALPDLVQLNRIAQTSQPSDDEALSPEDAVYDVNRLLERTRQVIASILVQSHKDKLPTLDLEGVDLANRRFDRAQLDGVRFRKAVLDGATFSKANLTKAAFRGSSLVEVVFTRANLEKADFTGSTGHFTAIKARLNEAQMHHCEFKNSDFDGASLRDVEAAHTDFDQSSFRGAQLHRAKFERCGMRGIQAEKMKAHSIVAEGGKLAKANLSEASLLNASFERCEMVGAVAPGLQAEGAKFVNCNLRGANFSGSDLSNTTFKGCHFGGADFRGANLTGSTISGEQLEAADFDEATRLLLGIGNDG